MFIYIHLHICAQCLCVLSCVRLFASPWALVHQAPLSMGFFRQEYWSALLFLSPGDLPDPGIKTASPGSPALAGRFFITAAAWETRYILRIIVYYIYIHVYVYI